MHNKNTSIRNIDNELYILQFYIVENMESITFPRVSPWAFPPDFDEQSCVNRSWADETSFCELEAGLMKEFLVK